MKPRVKYSTNRNYRDFYTDNDNVNNPTLIKKIKRKRKSTLDKLKDFIKRIIGKSI